MFALVSPEKVQLPPGAVMRLPATWQDYQTLSQQRGDQAIPRIKYRTGEVLLMSPLPEHARNAHLIANVVTVLLDHAGRDYEAFTPVTMELPEKSGIEPDYCFYINNWQAVAGKKRIDWSVNPPPDLVLEVDVTSYTNVNDYLPYRVPEVWLLRGEQVVIYCLQNEEYSPQKTSSQYFPDVNVQTVVAECLHAAYERNTSAALRELRQYLVNSINQS
jgi:Uma2 family endonuclease